MNLVNSILDEGSAAGLDRTALVCGQERWSYRRLRERTVRLAGALAAQGVGPGDRVVLMMQNRPDCVASLLACAHLGAILAPVNIELGVNEVQHAFANATPKVVLVDRVGATALAAIRDQAGIPSLPFLELPEPDGALVLGTSLEKALDGVRTSSPLDVPPDAPVLLLYTSGSTAVPKAVLWTHRGESWAAAAHAGIWRLNALDRVVVPLTLAWAYGLCTVTLSTLRAGATAILLPKFRPDELAWSVARERATRLFGVTTMYAMLDGFLQAAHPAPDLRSLEVIVTDERPNAELFERLQRTCDARILETYAMSELRPVMTYDPMLDSRALAGSCGRVVPGVEVKLVDADGQEVGEGTAGELWARSPGMLKEYFRQPEATAARLTDDGWFKTADLFERARDGYWYFQGRASEVIRRGSANVSPREVERVLREHPKVTDVAVVGIKDPVFMEAVAALVVGDFQKDSDPTAELRQFAAHSLADFKIPTVIRCVPAIPKTATGKLDRRAAAKSLLASTPSGPESGADSKR